MQKLPPWGCDVISWIFMRVWNFWKSAFIWAYFFMFFFCIYWNNSFQQSFEAKMKWRHYDVIKLRNYKTHRSQRSIRMKLGGQIDVEQEIVNPKFDANWAMFRFIMIFSIIIFINHHKLCAQKSKHAARISNVRPVQSQGYIRKFSHCWVRP